MTLSNQGCSHWQSEYDDTPCPHCTAEKRIESERRLVLHDIVFNLYAALIWGFDSERSVTLESARRAALAVFDVVTHLRDESGELSERIEELEDQVIDLDALNANLEAEAANIAARQLEAEALRDTYRNERDEQRALVAEWTVIAATEKRLGEEAVRNATGTARRFPVHSAGFSIPWALVAPFEAQAQRNHGGQTLERLAERGGLDESELWCVMHCKLWSERPSIEVAQAWALALVGPK